MSFYQQANAAEDRNKTPSYNRFKEVHPCLLTFIGVSKWILVGRELIEFQPAIRHVFPGGVSIPDAQ